MSDDTATPDRKQEMQTEAKTDSDFQHQLDPAIWGVLKKPCGPYPFGGLCGYDGSAIAETRHPKQHSLQC